MTRPHSHTSPFMAADVVTGMVETLVLGLRALRMSVGN